MEKYSNLKKGSKIIGYELGSDYIKVWMKEEIDPHTFTNVLNGQDRVEMMKKMAKDGHGLHRYIKRNISIDSY
ncbi:MAG: hypothetical protein HYU68_09020 [Bacteroidetes bacterium]|nr:hypothetical protein [Bacteroidota bacterium]